MGMTRDREIKVSLEQKRQKQERQCHNHSNQIHQPSHRQQT